MFVLHIQYYGDEIKQNENKLIHYEKLLKGKHI